MAEWYAPGEIKYWPEHVEWAITNLYELEEGNWPPNPADTGYTEGHGPNRGHNAYFEIPVCLAAEINVRLAMCNTDGKLTRKCLADGWDAQTLAELMHINQYSIDARVRRVVNYCSGQRRRRISYYEFKRRAGIKESYRRVRA